MKEYHDTPLYTQQRTPEAAMQLALLGFNHSQGSILEVGSGFGGVTKALRTITPDAPIITIDLDPQPEIAQAAKENNAIFFQRDLLDITPQELASFLQDTNTQTIVAMQTPADVALHLAHTLREINFKGKFYFSFLVIPSDRNAMRQLHIDFHQHLDKFVFSEDRLKTEYGYVLTYPLAQRDNVA